MTATRIARPLVALLPEPEREPFLALLRHTLRCGCAGTPAGMCDLLFLLYDMIAEVAASYGDAGRAERARCAQDLLVMEGERCEALAAALLDGYERALAARRAARLRREAA